MDKLKVSTNSRVEESKTNKILNYLVEHPEGATPKMIATGTSINVNTVKSILPKIDNVSTFTRGWYKVLNRGDGTSISNGTLSTWNYHNLYLSFPVEIKRYKDHNILLGNIKMRVKYHNNLVHLCLSTDEPLCLNSLYLVYGWIKSYFNPILTMKDITITSIEFNKDYPSLKMEGVKCLTIDKLCSQYKLYQKKRGLRVEHKTKVQFPLSHIGKMLNGEPEVNAHNDQLAKLTRQSIFNTNQLAKLMEKMK